MLQSVLPHVRDRPAVVQHLARHHAADHQHVIAGVVAGDHAARQVGV